MMNYIVLQLWYYTEPLVNFDQLYFTFSFGSTGRIFKSQLLKYSELLCAAIFFFPSTVLNAQSAKMKMHAKIKQLQYQYWFPYWTSIKFIF